MKRIWFKKDCVDWIKNGVKTTTWRTRKHEGNYEVVKGSWFKAKPIGLVVRLIPIKKITMNELIVYHFGTEGAFFNPSSFKDWLVANKLSNKSSLGWLHKIEVIDNGI